MNRCSKREWALGGAAGVVALAVLMVPAALSAQEWEWDITPYAWAADIGLDARINEREILDAEVEFTDLLDDVDFGLMLHAEGRKSRVGVFADLILIDLGDEPRVSSSRDLTLQAEADLEVILLDLGGVYYPGDSGFGIHYGARVIDVEQEIDLFAIGPVPLDRRIVDISETLVDGLVGLRYQSSFGTGWSFATWGDVSAGGTELSWSLAAVFGYSFGARDQFAVRFGYRHLEIELEEEGRLAVVKSDITMSGPLVGFTFSI